MIILNWLFEYWLPIKYYEGLYEISNWGRIKSLNYNHTGKHKILTPTKDKNGYLVITLYKPIKKRHYIHRLVAEHFLPNPKNLPIINHRDENTSNPAVWNLEWCSYSYNNTYGNAASKNAKKIGAFKNGVIVKEYYKAVDAENDGYNRRRIYKVIGKNNTAYGFNWKYI